jgi:hypothetical protein
MRRQTDRAILDMQTRRCCPVYAISDLMQTTRGTCLDPSRIARTYWASCSLHLIALVPLLSYVRIFIIKLIFYDFI